jgi:hypothetical protein
MEVGAVQIFYMIILYVGQEQNVPILAISEFLPNPKKFSIWLRKVASKRFLMFIINQLAAVSSPSQ